MTDLLQEALIAKESGDIALAKQLISQALIQQPGNEAAWMLMADVVEDVKLRRNCLERVLAINPNNSAASSALSKLNTSPLSPILRGERDKPLNPPQVEKVPPFTPPFTWEGEQEQFLALGDLTYPDLPGDLPLQPGNAVPTFDWANESAEPDKTIQKIFDAISNPDLASQPLPDTDLDWTVQPGDTVPADEGMNPESEYESKLIDQLVGTTDEVSILDQQALENADYSVSAEPQMGLDAFTSPDQALENVTPDYRLWDNPGQKMDRLVILSNRSLVYASPTESDVPHILGLFAENKMLRDLLGEGAGMIKLESITKLIAKPRQSTLVVEYRDVEQKARKKPFSHELKFSNPLVLDEVLEALQVRMGPGFTRSTRSFSLFDKIVPPLITLLVVAFIGWGLIAGLPLLGSQVGQLQPIVSSLQSLVTSIGALNILLLVTVIALIILIWLLSNLRQPSELIILDR